MQRVVSSLLTLLLQLTQTIFTEMPTEGTHMMAGMCEMPQCPDPMIFDIVSIHSLNPTMIHKPNVFVYHFNLRNIPEFFFLLIQNFLFVIRRT